MQQVCAVDCRQQTNDFSFHYAQAFVSGVSSDNCCAIIVVAAFKVKPVVVVVAVA